ncbi:hypothetical protein KXD93_06405 [Mucilaginibacter sp. BJC16-A38]|uniref:hypothetical protein n=1 Tax=Mucilaginibacter phenanthrenivorans TaxID=1234842 RepID=UPI002157B993|nr:hypothetical protein [Mucilaginibacter phenanthrenivorans]MCR8557263.1 hypothetical protein [Mucilaginibacter phenanthrenivorans]
MKNNRPYFLLLCLLLSTGVCCAQSTQSAMYDAIALMNAKNGINAIFNAHPHGFDIIDPLGESQPLLNKQVTPDSFIKNENVSQKIIIAILIRNANLPAGTSYNDLKKVYAKNPFLSDIFDDSKAGFKISQDATLAGLSGITISEQSGGVAGNIGGNLVNGVADFLVKRAGEELSASVFAKLQDFINRYPEFNILFPKTRALLKPIEPYDYAKTLVALKAAIQDDLDGLPAQLPLLYQLPRYKMLNKQVPELTLVFASAQLFSELHGKSSLSKSLNDLDTAGFLKEQNNYSTMIHLADITSNSIRKKLLSDSDDGDYPYFTAQDIGLATHQKPVYVAQLGKFYLGLLWQQISTYQFYDKDGAHQLSDLIGRYVSQTSTVINQFVTASDKLNTLGQQLATLKQRDDALKNSGQNVVSADRFVLYNQLIVGNMQLLQPFVQGDAADMPWKQQLAAICTYWPQFSTSGISMIKNISAKNYNLAITDLSRMLNNVSGYLSSLKNDKTTNSQLSDQLSADLATRAAALSKQIDAINATLKTLPKIADINDAQVKAAVILQIQNLQQNKVALNLQLQDLAWETQNSKDALTSLTKVLSYIDLLASLSQANNSQEVESILEGYALPAGSSRVKKDAFFNIALNAYVGGFYRSSNTGKGFTNQYGLTAPIGFAFSLGAQKAGSASLFISAIDIGSVIRYKLDNQGQYQQDINFAGLVSPGVQLVYGFGGYLPLSVGGGWQWTSPVTSTSNSIHLQSHFNLFLAVDIPLFNLSVVKKTVN